MAENITSEKRQPGKKRMNKKSTRVDLTPMVDLGFLLITFFVFTTAMSSAKAMDMQQPNDKDTTINDPVCESCAITIIPAGNNKLYYYEGRDKNAVYGTTNYSATGLRALLARKKKEVAALKRDAILIIKPGNTSSFANLINIIDESTITQYKRYYMGELSEKERVMMGEKQ